MHTDVRICSQDTGRELRIQIEQRCNHIKPSLRNRTNGNCIDTNITCGRATSFSEPYPTLPPMCDQSFDPPYYRPDDYSTTQCQSCLTCYETINYLIGQRPIVTTSSEPKLNTSSSKTNNLKVTDKRDSLIISLGILVGILVILLIVVASGWVWTYWTMKRNKAATTPEYVRYKAIIDQVPGVIDLYY